jgi:hypothetical protein
MFFALATGRSGGAQDIGAGLAAVDPLRPRSYLWRVTESLMPLSRLLLILFAVLVLGGVTVLLLIALPSDLRPWLIPILLIAAIALRISWPRR